METSLEDLLNGTEPEAVIDTVEDAQPEPQTDGPVRDENGRFAAKTGVEPQETAETVPPTEAQSGLPKDVYEPLKAVRSENKALKDQLDALTQQIQSLQQPQAQPAPTPSIWEDEQGFVGSITSQFEQRLYQQALATSQRLARIEHGPELVEKATQWGFDRCNADPQFNAAVLQSGDPVGYAVAEFKKAENYAKAQELGATDIETLKVKLREELMAEMQAQPAARPGLPPTLSNERNVGSRTGPAWSGPTSLTDMLR